MHTQVVITERRTPSDRPTSGPESGAAAAAETLSGQQFGGGLIGYEVTVNGVTLPAFAAAYEVVGTDDGPAVTVTIPAERVTVGPTPASPQGRVAGTWQGTARPDPRENIPGWKPEGVRADG